MSSKPKKARGTTAAKGKAKGRAKATAAVHKKQEFPRPTGKVPEAHVSSRHDGEMVSRLGRGFSLGELASSQMPFRLAKRWRLPLDLRRRTVLDDNVAAIKSWESTARHARGEGEVKKLEAEVVKVEKEVKGAAVKVEKGVKKAEEEIVEEAEAPVKKRVRKKKTPAKSD